MSDRRIGVILSLSFAASLTVASCHGTKGETAESVEHDARVSLTVGSTLPTVQAYLGGRGIESSFDPRSKTVSAVIRHLKDSNLIVREDLLLKFRFDDSLRLVRIDSKVGYTGP